MKVQNKGLTPFRSDNKLMLAGGLGVTLAGLGWSYARFIEPHWLEISRHRLPLEELGLSSDWSGYRIAFLSDLHMERSGPPSQVLVEAVNQVIQERPHLVLMGGDYFTRGVWNPEMGKLLHKMTESGLRVVAAMGNHDYFGRRKDPDRIIEGFDNSGACVLVNRAIPLEYNGQQEWLAVIDDARKGEPSLDDINLDLPASTRPLIFLSHNPDYAKKLPENYCRIVLSGHTHGGQINFAPPPFHERLNWIKFTRSQHKSSFPLGWYNVNGNRLYVSRGLGLSGWQLRLNARPELTMIEFVKHVNDSTL